VPFDAVGDALAAAGDLAGRPVIDVTNPLRMGGRPRAVDRVRPLGRRACGVAGAACGGVQTLNQVGYEVMASTTGYAAPPVMFVAGEDSTRKPIVMGLVADLGLIPIVVQDACGAGNPEAARPRQPRLYGRRDRHR